MNVTWAEYFQSLHGGDTVVDEIMEIYRESMEVYEECMTAMGQRTVVLDSKATSTEDIIDLDVDLVSENKYW